MRMLTTISLSQLSEYQSSVESLARFRQLMTHGQKVTDEYKADRNGPSHTNSDEPPEIFCPELRACQEQVESEYEFESNVSKILDRSWV